MMMMIHCRGENLYITVLFLLKLKLNSKSKQLEPHRLDETVDQDKDDGLVDAGGDARSGADGVDKLEAEGEDGGEEEGGDEDLNMRVKVKVWSEKRGV